MVQCTRETPYSGTGTCKSFSNFKPPKKDNIGKNIPAFSRKIKDFSYYLTPTLSEVNMPRLPLGQSVLI